MKLPSAITVLFISLCGATACFAQMANEPIDPESYAVYSALLSAELPRLAPHGTPLVVSNVTDNSVAQFEPKAKCFPPEENLPASALLDFKEVNKRVFRIEDRFETKPVKLVEGRSGRLLMFSAVGFDSDRKNAIVRLTDAKVPGEAGSTLDARTTFYLLRKIDSRWSKIVEGCRGSYSTLENPMVLP